MFGKAIEILNILISGGDLASRATGYGAIHKTHPVEYLGRKGTLVWDYIIWNELTFEDIETGQKFSLGTSFSDREMEKLFNDFVEKYGI